MQHRTIFGIDPGTRYLGYAVLTGEQLLDYGVHELQNGTKPYDLIGHARRRVLGLVARHRPTCIAIEEPYLLPTKRAALLSTLVQELHERAKEIGIEVAELSPEIVRRRLMGNAKATKYEVAQRLGERFTRLQPLVPAKPKNPALWLTSRERYWLHMFDALAMAVASEGSPIEAPI
jgi:Holliday junction resolvasome RuvABC endonuclease subunit